MASLFQAFPHLRTAAPRLSRQLCSAKPCFNSTIRPAISIARCTAPRPSVLQAVRWKSTQPLQNSATIEAVGRAAIVEAAAKTGPKSEAKSSSFPQTTSKSVAYWLLGSAASVFGIVIFGGLTRLTESGLSITEWKPVTGSLWPGSPEAWEAEYTKYKSSPEFAMLNSSMTLSEFKQIYFMEWAHRLWGRVIGVTFLLPTIYFIARKRVTPTTAFKLVGICGMIGFQGVIGWWMVKSTLR